MTVLYHYTANLESHVGSILRDGFIDVTESNISPRRTHAGPDVVWLTTHDVPSAGHGLDWGHGVPSKRAIRITVDVPVREVHKWREWAAGRGMDPFWMRRLAAAGGANSWRVVQRPIPQTEWVAVHNMVTGDVLWSREGAAA